MLLFRSRKLRMCWTVSKGGARSYLVGTSHFFPYDMKKPIRRLLEDIDTVLLEGPLDRQSFDTVVSTGLLRGPGPTLYESLDEDLRASLNAALFGDFLQRTDFVALLGMFNRTGKDPLHSLIKGLSPWMAFFTIWTHYLDEKGWRHSVDLDAFSVAKDMGKEVRFLETVEEHLAVLRAIPVDRIMHFLRMNDRWEDFIKGHVRHYLKGDLEAQMELSKDFPSRCDMVIDSRDPIMYERMLTYFEQGRAAAFVGTPHTKNLKAFFENDGFTVSR